MNQSLVISAAERHGRSPSVSDTYRAYVLVVLLLVGVAGWVDRQVFSITLESIKHELLFSDTQLGLIGGVAFGLFYASVGLPIAWLADRTNRRNLISAGLALWSAMTAVSGMALGFGSLFLARMGVGIGEAGGAAPSQSLISDYFPPERRGFALGIFYAYIPLGYLIAYWMGALSSDAFGWRATFLAFGIPGLLLAALVKTTVRELPRGHAEHAFVSPSRQTLTGTLRYFLSRPSLRHLPLAGAAHGIGAFGAAVWMPAYFIRVHAMPQTQVGMSLALIMGVAGLCGALGGGHLADVLARRTGNARWYVWLPAGMLLLSVPFTVLVYSTHSARTAMLLYIFPAVANHVLLGPITATMQNLAGIRRRSMVAAFYLFLVNLIATGLGPLIVGAVSDLFNARFGTDSLRYSLLFLVSVTCLWACAHLLLAGRTLREDLRVSEVAP